jgi:hypothetical protein
MGKSAGRKKAALGRPYSIGRPADLVRQWHDSGRVDHNDLDVFEAMIGAYSAPASDKATRSKMVALDRLTEADIAAAYEDNDAVGTAGRGPIPPGGRAPPLLHAGARVRGNIDSTLPPRLKILKYVELLVDDGTEAVIAGEEAAYCNRWIPFTGDASFNDRLNLAAFEALTDLCR